MNDGIWKIGNARMCPECSVDMADEYVMRCMGSAARGSCDRCGRDKPLTHIWKYTMKGKALRRRGLA